VRSFVDRAFGMKACRRSLPSRPPARGCSTFSSTTATRVLSILAAEGATPFIGAWLRERVAPAIPPTFVNRPLDENCWNACVAAALGRAFVVSTDPLFLRGHQMIMSALESRVGSMSGTLGASPHSRTRPRPPSITPWRSTPWSRPDKPTDQMSEALRDELRELIAGFRTHLELRERSGALGVPAGRAPGPP
jgi:hypothetical protein